jgi:hypothetical protein
VNTYWSYEVQVDGVAKVAAGAAALNEAIARAITDCLYYQAHYPGSQVRIANIRELCEKCRNQRTIEKRGPRSLKTIRCPECKGQGADRCLAPTPFALPDPANGIRLCRD